MTNVIDITSLLPRPDSCEKVPELDLGNLTLVMPLSTQILTIHNRVSELTLEGELSTTNVGGLLHVAEQLIGTMGTPYNIFGAVNVYQATMEPGEFSVQLSFIARDVFRAYTEDESIVVTPCVEVSIGMYETVDCAGDSPSVPTNTTAVDVPKYNGAISNFANRVLTNLRRVIIDNNGHEQRPTTTGTGACRVDSIFQYLPRYAIVISITIDGVTK